MQIMGRTRKPTNLTLDPAVLARLDEWIARQPFRPKRSGVVEDVLTRFLDEEEAKSKDHQRRYRK